MAIRILRGNCVDTLRTLDEKSVHACVTSPPYWALRDYGTEPVAWPAIAYSPMPGVPACIEVPAMEACLGLEPTLGAFIGHIVQVFREVRRVLRDDGTCWVNMGDCYASAPGQASRGGPPSKTSTLQGNGHRGGGPKLASLSRVGLSGNKGHDSSDEVIRPFVADIKPKDLIGQPWRVAFALQADGWYLRQDCIWSKKNPMPESTKDRCTKAHEYVFLLSKSERYYWNLEAMQEPASEATHARMAQDVQNQRGSDRAHAGGKTNGAMRAVVRGSSDRTPAGWATGTDGRTHNETAGRYSEQRRTARQQHEGNDSAYADGKSERSGRAPGWRKLAVASSGTKNNGSFDAAMAVMPLTRNKRSVWHIGTEPFSEAHFATFPTELIRQPILASCPEGGTVLDCFGGSGTTGLVADQHGRNAILCELSDDYIEIAKRRVAGDTPLFTEITEAA